MDFEAIIAIVDEFFKAIKKVLVALGILKEETAEGEATTAAE